jgi:caa(3)-type oxidase subunit IV
MTTESHPTHDHGGPDVKAYFVVFGALAIFTLVSFVANYAAHPEHHWITPGTSFVIILGVAIVKAVLVAMFFMHLKYDWGKVFFLVIPVLILAAMMITVLLPDQTLVWLDHVGPYGFHGSADVPPPPDPAR